MENFFYEENFCSDIEDLMGHFDLYTKEDVEALEDGWHVEVMHTELRKMFVLKERFFEDLVEWLYECNVDEYPEDTDNCDKKIMAALKASIDIEKLNAGIPELYYPADGQSTITKADLLEYLK